MPKNICFTLYLTCILFLSADSQKLSEPGWHLKDFQQDSLYGISLNKAYQFLEEKKIKSQTVVVAILDNGIDTAHEDLRAVLWHNPKEIPGNKKDDDNNGYVDDYYGWNFLGNPDGRNVMSNSSEWLRVYWRYKSNFEGKNIDTAKLSTMDKYEYGLWVKARSGVVGAGMSESKIDTLNQYFQLVSFCDSALQIFLHKKEYSISEVSSFKPLSEKAQNIKDFMVEFLKSFEIPDVKNNFAVNELHDYIISEERKAAGEKVPPENNRKDITGDDETNPDTRFYGNGDVEANDGMHGTHLAGIIGAVRNNGIGMDGIADNVKIMMVRTTPEGDEFDKDIAMGIRYAVDNGARVINMSFGKSLSPDKKMIDNAVQYALKKDVLIVQGAGNSKRNIDGYDNFPNPKYLFSDSIAPNWITVGASDCNGKAADFSNYGNKIVDVFAPGVDIYSTIVGNKYMSWSGTSMATPMVTGLAALLRSYFPSLSAVEIKNIITASVSKLATETIIPGTSEKGNYNKLCSSGGIINAYNAVVMAYDTTSKKR